MFKLALDKAITNPAHDYAETLAKNTTKWGLENAYKHLLIKLFNIQAEIIEDAVLVDKTNAILNGNANFMEKLAINNNLDRMVKLDSSTIESLRVFFGVVDLKLPPNVKLDELPVWALFDLLNAVNKFQGDYQNIHSFSYSSGLVDYLERLIVKDGSGSYSLKVGNELLVLACDSDRWLTVHPHGKEHEGQAIKISEKDIIKAGLGGKYNGKHISELCAKSNNQANTASNAGNSKATSASHKSQSKAKPVSQAAAKSANTKQGSTKSAKAAAKPAQAKLGSTKSAKAAAKPAQAKQGSTKSVEAAANPAQTKQGSTKSAQAAEKPVKANLKPSKLNVALYGVQNGTAATSNNEEPAFVNNALQRDHELCLLALSNQTWRSVNGIKFDDERKNAQFLATEQRYYWLRALQYLDAKHGTNTFAQYEQEAKCVVAKYNRICNDWARDQQKDLSKDIANLNIKSQELIQLVLHKPYKPASRSICKLSKAPYICYLGSVVKGGILSWSQKVNSLVDHIGKKSYTSAISQLPSCVSSYVVASDCLQRLDDLRSKGGMDEEQSRIVDRFYNRARFLENKAKAVLLASTNTLSVEDALYVEACKELKLKDPDNFSIIHAPYSLVGVPKKGEMSFEEADGNAPNPHFNVNLKVRLKGYPYPIPPYKYNCQSCVITFEMRRRGFNVEARPFLEPNVSSNEHEGSGISFEKLASTSLIAWRKKDSGLLPMPRSHDSIHSVASAIKNGERHMLMYRTGKQGGHIVNLECDEHGVFIYDPQSGERYSVDEFADKVGIVKAITTFRVDDCELAPHIAPKVLIQSKVGIPPTLRKFAVKDSLTEDSIMKEGSIEWFKVKLEQQTYCHADYAGELDGCMIFYLSVDMEEGALCGPPIYAICDPNNLDEVDVKQGYEIYKRLCEKYPKSEGGKLID